MYVKLLHDHYCKDHLEAVKAEMQALGAPTIRVIEHDGMYYAVEGCHRLRAAHDLGIVPDWIELEYGDDLSDIEGFVDTYDYTADDAYETLCGWAMDVRNAVVLRFDA